VSTSPVRTSSRSSSASRNPWLVVPQAGERLAAVAAPGDDLGDHRVELRRDHVALGDARVDAQAGTGREAQQGDAAGRGHEPERRVLRVEPRLDRVAARRRRIAFEAAAGRDVELQLDDVDACDHLGHRVLDLEACVDLHEGEALRGRLVEELDGRGVAVAGAQDEPARGLHDLALLLGREPRAGGLLDHLLVAALVGAVAQAERPRGALPVGDHLDLDVPRGGDETLHQQRAVAERLACLGGGAGERGGQAAGLVDAPDAAAAATGGGLDHERVADRLGLDRRVLGVRDRPAAPRRDRHAAGLGELLGGDLVAERAHDLRARPHEHDVQPLAQLDEPGVLGDEAPADPDRVGARCRQRARERVVVQVADPLAGLQLDGLVGTADEHRLALAGRVQRDDRDRVVPLGVELADGMDQPHRGLAAVDDREPGEGPLHQPFSIAARIGASASWSMPPGSSVVR
jgi:hypothetical protein